MNTQMSNTKLWLLNFFTRLTRPTHWVKLGRTFLPYDKWVLQQIEKDTWRPVDRYTCMLGDKEIWVRNYPYSYGSIYHRGDVVLGSYVAAKLRRYIQTKEYPLEEFK